MDSERSPSDRLVLQPIPPVNAFDRWCISLNRTNTDIGKFVGVSDDMVSRYRRGARPTYDVMLRIRTASGGAVSLESWSLAVVA